MFLVTGGAGFIGSHITAQLLDNGHDVRVFDNFSSGKLENLDPIRNHVEIVEGDLRDQDAVNKAVAGVEIVLHQGAVPSVPRSIADPGTTFDANVRGTLNLLLAARDAGCRRVVIASSSSVYGNTPVLPKAESMTPNPLSPYAISKLSGEQLCSVFTGIYGLETVALRYFNVFGPRQDPNSQYSAVIPKFLKALHAGETPTIYGDGEQSRDFTFVDNVVHANLCAARATKATGRVFNIASGRAISLNRLLAELSSLLGIEAKAIYEAPRPGDVRDSLADISQAREVLGYDVLVSFEEGLKRTVAATAAPAFAS
jgi:nucleoside-diphosphate-sugar epimerase